MNTPTREPTLLDALDGLGKLVEMSTGFRTMLERAGYSPTMAEQLAANYLNGLVNSVVGGIGK